MPKIKNAYPLTVNSPLFIGQDGDAWSDASGHVIHLGTDMFIADVAADKDHTITLYTEKYVLDNYNIIVKVEEAKNANQIS